MPIEELGYLQVVPLSGCLPRWDCAGLCSREDALSDAPVSETSAPEEVENGGHWQELLVAIQTPSCRWRGRGSATCPRRSGRVQHARRPGRSPLPERTRPADAQSRRPVGAEQPAWLIEPRRIGPLVRNLRRVTDPLFRQAGISLDDEG